MAETTSIEIKIPWDARDGFEPVENPDLSMHDEVVHRIMRAYHKAKEVQAGFGSAYQPSKMWIPFMEARREYLDALSSRDEIALGNLLKNLWRNSGSNFLIKYGLYEDYDKPENHLRLKAGLAINFSAWNHFVRNKNIEQLRIPPIGNPFGVYYKDVLITSATFNNHYESEKVAALLDGIKYPIVGEIGAGIGLLPYYMMRDIPNLRYFDFDLPEIQIITQYFLMMAYPKKRFLLFGEKDWIELTRRDTLQYDFILLPNFEVRKADYHLFDVFVNFHSLSEMSQETIDEYMKHITRATRLYFYMENTIHDFEIFNGGKELSVNHFPYLQTDFVQIYKSYAIWGEPVYREYLFKKR